MSLEIGLHRHDNLLYLFPEESERKRVINLFWWTYVLDRRWSFGTGLPFALNEADISLPDLVRAFIFLAVAFLVHSAEDG